MVVSPTHIWHCDFSTVSLPPFCKTHCRVVLSSEERRRKQMEAKACFAWETERKLEFPRASREKLSSRGKSVHNSTFWHFQRRIELPLDFCKLYTTERQVVQLLLVYFQQMHKCDETRISEAGIDLHKFSACLPFRCVNVPSELKNILISQQFLCFSSRLPISKRKDTSTCVGIQYEQCWVLHCEVTVAKSSQERQQVLLYIVRGPYP